MDSQPVTCRLTVPGLSATAGFQFPSSKDASLVRTCVDGRLSGARLPGLMWNDSSDPDDTWDVRLDVEDLGADLRVRFSGAVTTDDYVVDKIGFHWDFTKVFTSIAIPSLLDNGIVTFHAAVLEAGQACVVLPGSSGAGKSSISYAARTAGAEIRASELAFVKDGALVAGNQTLTIDPAALTRFGLSDAAVTHQDGRATSPVCSSVEPRALSGVVFPKVCDSKLVVRRISQRRARMLLYENAISQLPFSQLIAHETSPISILPTRKQLSTVADEVQRLSHLGSPAMVEGQPREIAAFLMQANSE